MSGVAPARPASHENVVWLSPSATTFSCLCERCLDESHAAGAGFADAVRGALLRGAIATDVEVVRAHCAAGHELVLRRVERPPALARHDERQMQLV
jgi:hypothetical protein